MSHPTDTKHIILGLLAPLCVAAACTGTPTPHPPDFLPSPDGGLINQIIPEVTTAMDPVIVPLAGDPGAVQGGTDVWVVNLDQATVPPVRVRARADGSFGPIDVVGSEGDRVRIVSRTAQRHSRPLDFEILLVSNTAGLRPLMDTSLDCLEVTPADELSLADEGSFVLTNECAAPVTVSGAQLRFGDQGFALGTLGQTLAVGAELRITVTFEGDDPDQQADILMLDVQSGTNTGRYALGLWSLP